VPTSPLRLTPPVRAARDAGLAIVALESSVLAQGLPIPANRDAADRTSRAVEEAGAVPAVAAVARGVPTLGLLPDELERFLGREGVGKVSARDLPEAMVSGADGATTVAATMCLAALGGVEVFATGGIGGVHREPRFDESADLVELARTPVLVVCAGAKSILDLAATLERLETLGVPVVGFGTAELPGFFTTTTGLPLPARVDDVGELAAIWRAHRSLGRTGGMLVVQPPPPEAALPRDLVEEAVAAAIEEARRDGVRGARSTPYLLAAVERATGGRSLATNLALLERNAALAGRLAVALANDGRA
jgi:pseudouridine-5'-phosphate glycosidase